MNLGLTGGIATGKSTASEFFREKGLRVICADKIAREVVEKKDILEALASEFGESIIYENKLDRKKLREIVFKDKLLVEKLNSITHPAIISQIKKEIEMYRDEKIIVLDIPLLFEGNYEFLVDKILLITCDLEKQIERVQKRDSVSKENAENIIKNQMPMAEKVDKADFVLENNEEKIDFLEKLEKFFEKIKAYQ